LEILKETHSAAIDLIYIDPPYNTGENDFKYSDKFAARNDDLKHTQWISFMRKRLLLAKDLLKETGVIIIHIDENQFGSLNVLLDGEIFGERNNLGTIIWNKKNPKGDAKGISTMHEYIFCYTKNKKAFLKLENTVTRKKPNAVEILKKSKITFFKNRSGCNTGRSGTGDKTFQLSQTHSKRFYCKI
jgi:adenine-specific DNA-methyltransferase